MPLHAWRDVVETASKISDQSAFGILKQIPDPEIQVLEEVMLASAWLNVPLWRNFSPMAAYKKD